MPPRGDLKLVFQDVYKKKLKGTLNLRLTHASLRSASRQKKNIPAYKILVVPDLRTGDYRITILPDLYRMVRKWILIREGRTREVILTFPVRPGKVKHIEAPDYRDLSGALKKALRDSSVASYPDKEAKALYLALNETEKAGLLNLYCKMRHTVLENKRNVFSYVTAFQHIQGDRIYADVRAALYHEVRKNVSSGLFHPVSGALHPPLPGYTLVESFKTGEAYGNLQLTFFRTGASPRYMVDADIDEAGGIQHLFDVIYHHTTGKKTDPFDIHEILIQHQQLDPKYRLIV